MGDELQDMCALLSLSLHLALLSMSVHREYLFFFSVNSSFGKNQGTTLQERWCVSLSLSVTCQQTDFSHLAEGEENADCRKTRASCKEAQKENAPHSFEGAQARNISPWNKPC